MRYFVMRWAIVVVGLLGSVMPAVGQAPNQQSTVSTNGNAIITMFSPAFLPSNFMPLNSLLKEKFPNYNFGYNFYVDGSSLTVAKVFCNPPKTLSTCTNTTYGARALYVTEPGKPNPGPLSGGQIQLEFTDPQVPAANSKNVIQVWTYFYLDANQVAVGNSGVDSFGEPNSNNCTDEPFYNEHTLRRRFVTDSGIVDHASDQKKSGNEWSELFYDFSWRGFYPAPAKSSGKPSKCSDGKDVVDLAPQFYNDLLQWSANLWPVVVDGMNVTADDGISWGWTAISSLFAYYDDGAFVTEPPSCLVIGCQFEGGTIEYGGSRLTFTQPVRFDPTVNENFSLGTLTLKTDGVLLSEPLGDVPLSISIGFANTLPAGWTVTVPNTIDIQATQSDTKGQCAYIKPSGQAHYNHKICVAGSGYATKQIVGKFCYTATPGGGSYKLLIEGFAAPIGKIDQQPANDCG